MGLSSKQVSRDVGAGDGTELVCTKSFLEEFSKNHTQVIQQQQQLLLQGSQMAPLKCPRCDSMNTKFCYYNNYNRSQPRHFCKACKRHWTKGGMLRNVPVGGGRKNKRLKTTNTNNNNNNKSTSKRVNITNRQRKQQQQHIVVTNDCHDLGHVTVLEPMRETWREDIQMNQRHQNLNQAFSNPTTLDFVNNQNSFLVASEDDDLSSSPVPNFNFTGFTSTLENHPSSMSSSSSFAEGFHSSNVFNFIGEETGDEDLTNQATITTSPILLPPRTTPWQAPANTNSILDSTTMTPPVNWSWEDLNTLISTDLNQPWDDNGNQDK